MTSEPQLKQQVEYFSMNKKNKSHVNIYIYIYIYIYPHTRVSSFPGLIGVARVNE